MAGGVLVIGVLVLAVGMGLFLYATVGGASHTLSDALALITSVFWIAAGVAMIVGGFVTIGAIIIVFYVFIGVGKADRLSDTDIRGKLNG